MDIVEPSINVWGEVPYTEDESILWIEKAGRTCYRSEDKIVNGSGKVFVRNIINRKHFSVIEHSNLVMRTSYKNRNPKSLYDEFHGIFELPHFHFAIQGDYVYVAGNYRVWIEWMSKHLANETVKSLNDLDYNYREYFNQICEMSGVVEIVTESTNVPDELKAFTVEYITNRAVTHELVRHRPASYSQESQRYCQYGELGFIRPYWYINASVEERDIFYCDCVQSEENYRKLLMAGLNAQSARVVLPNSTATKIVMTCYLPEWEHIFNLRCSKSADPSMREIAIPTKEHFKKNNWIE